jgi:hypothetical protein
LLLKLDLNAVAAQFAGVRIDFIYAEPYNTSQIFLERGRHLVHLSKDLDAPLWYLSYIYVPASNSFHATSS